MQYQTSTWSFHFWKITVTTLGKFSSVWLLSCWKMWL